MIHTLPYTVELEEGEFPIRNNGDFRIVLDIFAVLKDDELGEQEKTYCILFIFFGENYKNIKNINEASVKVLEFMNCGQPVKTKENDSEPPIMDWTKDFEIMLPSLNKTIGYDIRTPEKFTHWWTIVTASGVMGECTFMTVLQIRQKLQKNKKLEKHEKEFYKANRELIELDSNSMYDEYLWQD